MQNHRSTIDDISSRQYKNTTCVARSCNKAGIHALKISFLNKLCKVCSEHRDEFLSLGLLEPIENMGKEVFQ